ncbi:MAG: hypothetical protein AAF709_19640 [Pseudomonadota bacterium]
MKFWLVDFLDPQIARAIARAKLLLADAIPPTHYIADIDLVAVAGVQTSLWWCAINFADNGGARLAPTPDESRLERLCSAKEIVVVQSDIKGVFERFGITPHGIANEF